MLVHGQWLVTLTCMHVLRSMYLGTRTVLMRLAGARQSPSTLQTICVYIGKMRLYHKFDSPNTACTSVHIQALSMSVNSHTGKCYCSKSRA